ncbi:hypothetical protein NO2_0039 [Candidatus Termititenax persephonae]|uniref:Phage-Barnase-EndoU-ColicinE5/D-RelE like nuclease 3 domain-containing protein n=1 Tax=Candidatus Termititenax persephonae TaxID=2218525 RepID=A0A388TE99_9BACT|nr:hypothetical protein NO2_0039 [Candidatus Termititenax persephonae]
MSAQKGGRILRVIENYNSDFREEEHPRNNNGKFSTSSGSGSSKSKPQKTDRTQETGMADDLKTKKQKQEIISRLDKDYIQTAEEFFEKAKGKIKQRKEKVYRSIDKQEAKRIKDVTGLDVEGYEHKIINEDFAHIFRRHGNPRKQEKLGQVAVTKDDLKLIPEITKNYDSLKLSPETSEGRPVLVYTKKIGNEYYYLETVGGKKTRDLRSKSMWIRKTGTTD